MRTNIFLILFLLFAIKSYTQDSTVYVVTGKVIDSESLKAIPSVLLVNTTKSYATSTDTSGKYRILMTRNDKIKISCIGYETENWKPDFSKSNSKNKITNEVIYLNPKTYEIGKVNIYQARWEAFVYNMANTNFEEKELDKRIIRWITKIVADEELSKAVAKSGIRIPLPISTHREKQLRMIAEQKKIDELNKIADKKFNKKLVADITQLEGQELDEFMNYCNFERNFVLSTSEYELIIIIQDIFKEYKIINK